MSRQTWPALKAGQSAAGPLACWWKTLTVVRPPAFSSFSFFSWATWSALGSTTSSSSRALMSAPSMKKRSSRNMMSIIGMRLQATLSSTCGPANLLMLVLRCGALVRLRSVVGRHVLEQVDRLQVDRQGQLGDLVLEEEIGRQEDDRDEQAHGRVHQRLVDALREVARRGRLHALDRLEGRDHAGHGPQQAQ